MTENELGIEEVRAQLGDLVDDAHYEGTITHITRRGRRLASIVPAGVKATSIPDEAIDAAFDAAWPGLPEGVSVGEARRRVIAALNAAYPHMMVPAEPEVLPDLDRLKDVSASIEKQLTEGAFSPEQTARMRAAAEKLAETIRETRIRMTHQQIVTKAIKEEGGTWDAARTQTTLGLAGHAVDDKRARAVLRRIAATGLLTRTSQTRAIYNSTEK
jgi:antitoxin (DNA-binding transcriptional repressor) of toxin-antitoxin stability system